MLEKHVMTKRSIDEAPVSHDKENTDLDGRSRKRRWFGLGAYGYGGYRGLFGGIYGYPLYGFPVYGGFGRIWGKRDVEGTQMTAVSNH